MSPAPEPVVVEGFVVDVVNLLRWPGSQAVAQLDEPMSDLATSAAAASHVRGALVVDAMSDSLSVTGELTVDWQGDCRRCLGDAEGSCTVDFQEIFERRPVEGETFQLTDDTVDLEPMVRELVMLGLPLAPLCGDDCRGPAPEAFPALPEVDEEPTPSGDPRWAALDALVFDDDDT